MNRYVALAVAFTLSVGTVDAQEVGGNEGAKQKFVVDEVAAVVGSSMILLSDIQMSEEYLKDQYMRNGQSSNNLTGEAFESLLMQKLLATRAALDSLTINEISLEQSTEDRLNQVIEIRGSQKELEKFYNKPIFAIKDLLRVKMREVEMAQAMQREVQSKVTITPSEVEKFYKSIDKDSLPIISEQYVYSRISKLPSKSDERKLDVKEALLDIRNRIINGASFSALARMYSDDKGSAVRGGEMDAQPANMFVAEFKDAVETLKIGQLSGVIETEYGFHILEVLEQRGNLYRVRHILMRIKFNPEDKSKAIEQMDSVYKEISNGNLEFETAVARYSEDKQSRVNGGVVTNNFYQRYGAKYKTNRFSKEELDRLYTHISKLKVGEISAPFEFVDMAGDESVQMIKLLEIIPAHPASIEHDYSTIEEMALHAKRNKTFNEWLDKAIDEMYIKIEKPYSDIELSNKKWLK